MKRRRTCDAAGADSQGDETVSGPTRSGASAGAPALRMGIEADAAVQYRKRMSMRTMAEAAGVGSGHQAEQMGLGLNEPDAAERVRHEPVRGVERGQACEVQVSATDTEWRAATVSGSCQTCGLVAVELASGALEAVRLERWRPVSAANISQA